MFVTFDLLRMLMLTFWTVMLFEQPAVQMIGGTVIQLWFLFFLMFVQPYRFKLTFLFSVGYFLTVCFILVK
jgi:hypothetical protein